MGPKAMLFSFLNNFVILCHSDSHFRTNFTEENLVSSTGSSFKLTKHINRSREAVPQYDIAYRALGGREINARAQFLE